MQAHSISLYFLLSLLPSYERQVLGVQLSDRVTPSNKEFLQVDAINERTDGQMDRQTDGRTMHLERVGLSFCLQTRHTMASLNYKHSYEILNDGHSYSFFPSFLFSDSVEFLKST
jgi:hypothetical protein